MLSDLLPQQAGASGLVPYALADGARAHRLGTPEGAEDQPKRGVDQDEFLWIGKRGTRLGPASHWLIADLKDRLSDWQPLRRFCKSGRGRAKADARSAIG